MPETLPNNYQSISNKMTVPGKHFYVHLAGETKGAHHTFVEKLKDVGHTEVQSPEESDYLSVFCPISSRVGTDINEALDHIPGGKPAILVVMHHTFDPDHVVAPSRRHVDNPNVLLTVDCLFYERKLLECNRNDIAWHDVQKCLGIPLSQVSTWKQYCRRCWRKNWKLVVVACFIIGGLGIGSVIYFEMIKKYDV